MSDYQEKAREARVIRRIVFTVTSVIALILVGGGIFGYVYVSSALEPVDAESNEMKTVNIPIGSSVTSISDILEEAGIVKNATIFRYYTKFNNESDFQAGEYQLSPNMELDDIIASLKTGKVVEEVLFRITIPEGKQLKEISEIIAGKTAQEEADVWAILNDEAYLKELQSFYPKLLGEDAFAENVQYPLEGYLFPATYGFTEEAPSVKTIIQEMLKKTNDMMNQYSGQIQEKGLTVHEWLTMASLIEEEATAKTDRDLIASVFFNRIDEGMPLQTDPTILYALGEQLDRVLYEDLEVDSPYNTYKNTGLPPGPIANAGQTSLEAALEPETSSYLYFQADEEGEVYFTKTLEEHNERKAEIDSRG
ncbi:endolytic transglycosylase MltG [Bacillus fonticola]|uniref:endolytic transglycosylase MltG n=1 Tax=Bacillus fonticola TaxID=2728853 RepID=UPI001D145E0D|nr:endolytic transglycosylase MltG [Bacillus fonticola]